jgi:hypothetical protein
MGKRKQGFPWQSKVSANFRVFLVSFRTPRNQHVEGIITPRQKHTDQRPIIIPGRRFFGCQLSEKTQIHQTPQSSAAGHSGTAGFPHESPATDGILASLISLHFPLS